uniref:Uncharacterized protein n=1 Tax=Acrobeloides nanus TaxID=290746 RepID=A0A914CH35_9BILA
MAMNPPRVLAKVRNFLPQFAAANEQLIQNNNHDNCASSSDSGISVERVEESEEETTETDYDSDDEKSDCEMSGPNDVEQRPQNIQFEILTFEEGSKVEEAGNSNKDTSDEDEEISDEQERIPQAFKRKRKIVQEPSAKDKKPRLIEEL